MKAKFEIGETVYVMSRRLGIVRRVVVSIIEPEDTGFEFDKPEYGYELNHTVMLNKGYMVGEDRSYSEEAEYIFPAMYYSPAPEFILMRMGDKIFDTHPIGGGLTEEILTKKHINDDSKL